MERFPAIRPKKRRLLTFIAVLATAAFLFLLFRFSPFAVRLVSGRSEPFYEFATAGPCQAKIARALIAAIRPDQAASFQLLGVYRLIGWPRLIGLLELETDHGGLAVPVAICLPFPAISWQFDYGFLDYAP